MSRSRSPTPLAPIATEHAEMDSATQQHEATDHVATEHAPLASARVATEQAAVDSVAQQHEATYDVVTEHAALDRIVVQTALEGVCVPATLQEVAQVVKTHAENWHSGLSYAVSNPGHTFALKEIRDDYVRKCGPVNESALYCAIKALLIVHHKRIVEQTSIGDRHNYKRQAEMYARVLEHDTTISVPALARKSGLSEGYVGIAPHTYHCIKCTA